jgi:hypothetical protein
MAQELLRTAPIVLDIESRAARAVELGKDLSFVVAAWLISPGPRPDIEPAAREALGAWLAFEDMIPMREHLAQLASIALKPQDEDS